MSTYLGMLFLHPAGPTFCCVPTHTQAGPVPGLCSIFLSRNIVILPVHPAQFRRFTTGRVSARGLTEPQLFASPTRIVPEPGFKRKIRIAAYMNDGSLSTQFLRFGPGATDATREAQLCADVASAAQQCRRRPPANPALFGKSSRLLRVRRLYNPAISRMQRPGSNKFRLSPFSVLEYVQRHCVTDK